MNESQELLNALPIPALLIGADERVAAINAAATRLLGGVKAGRHYITVLRQPATLDAIERAFKDGGRHTAMHLLSDTQRDTTWQVDVCATGQDQIARSVLVSFQDLTAVDHANKMRRDFVSNVSHELRTPLTAVLGFVETLRGAARDDPAARDRFLGIIDREAGRMARLVDDLLSLSRVEEEERRRPDDIVELGEMISSTLTTLAPLAEASNVSLTFIPPAHPVKVPGDLPQLRQVLTNLIENAIKYGGPDKTVTASLSGPSLEPILRANAVRLSVSDEGEGIPEHQIPRLTERFYRLDSHRSRELGGTGLGLAIVKHIISRHRGRLRISSKPGQGSTFTVLLPTD